MRTSNHPMVSTLSTELTRPGNGAARLCHLASVARPAGTLRVPGCPGSRVSTCRVLQAAGRWIVAFALGLALVARGADPAETRAADAAVKMLQEGLYDLAEHEAAGFVGQYPTSDRLPEIVLVEAQAQLRQKKYDAALALLRERASAAGTLADEFAFWQAVTLYEKGDLGPAADAFAKMAADFTSSARRTEALYQEAYVRARLGQENRAVDLLRAPEGAFQQTMKARPGDEWVARGLQLLAEMLLARGDGAGAGEALKPLDGWKLPAAVEWQRAYLGMRVDAAAARWQDALARATNLWTAATNSIRPELLASAVMLQGEILEHVQQPVAAMAVYERNLGREVPGPMRQAAVQKLYELGLQQSRFQETISCLDALGAADAHDPLLDVITVAAGELRLRQYVAAIRARAGAEDAPETLTLLRRAAADFDRVITNFPQSGVLGQAQFGRGWCLWQEGTNRVAEAGLSFQSAATLLPKNADQAVAYFKLADCQFLDRAFSGAISNYWRVATNYADTKGVTSDLRNRALYQAVRAGIEAQDLGSATAAMSLLLQTDPAGELADSSTLLMGQALNRRGNPRAARAVYESFAERFTNSVLLPEVRLAIAHTFEQEQAWPSAVGAYSNWMAVYGRQTNVASNLQAQAGFDLARLSYQTRPDTNALTLLTNYVFSHPSSSNAPLAQYLAAEYLYNQGDFAKSELMFQDKVLSQNPAAYGDGLAYRARLMAGRAAVALRSYRGARDHFDWVITNGPLHLASSRAPVPVVAEAYIFRGDTFLLEDGEGKVNTFERFTNAITAFSKVAERFPTNELAPIAWGRIGDCQLQLATQDPRRYAAASAAYQHVVDSHASISARSMAEVGLGVVLEKQAALKPAPEQPPLQDQALDHYLRVFEGRNLRPDETPDPYWVKRAGLAAAELAEDQKKWDRALGLYRRLLNELPPLSVRLSERIAELEKQKLSGSNGAK